MRGERLEAAKRIAIGLWGVVSGVGILHVLGTVAYLVTPKQAGDPPAFMAGFAVMFLVLLLGGIIVTAAYNIGDAVITEINRRT